jgi:hypothetical protein
MNNPVRLTDPTGMAPEGGAVPDDKWRGVWNNETQKYDYTWVSNEGGEEYDIIEHYSANMASKDSYRRETRIDNPYYGDDRYASSREGMGKWRGIATGKAATMDGADDPIFRGILAIMTRGTSEGIGSLEMGGVSKMLGLAKGGFKGVKTSGWVKRSIFESLDPAIQKKVVAALKNGIVAPTGKQGIIKLTATEAAETGFTHKIKILGKGGDLRIFGKQGSNGHILFEKLARH